jgi:hypothetical protein
VANDDIRPVAPVALPEFIFRGPESEFDQDH